MIPPELAHIENLEMLIKEYHAAVVATNECPSLCSSDPYRGKEAAVLMQKMYEAQSKLFDAVHINYHGNNESGLRYEDDDDA